MKAVLCWKKIHFLYYRLIAILLQPRHFELYTKQQQHLRNLHINKIFISYIFQDLIFMNWHTQLLFTQKIIINNLPPCIQKRPGNISNPSWSYQRIALRVYILRFLYIQHISFKIHQVIGFYFEYQSYVRNLHFFVQIFMYSFDS